jgi:hypothetical protein
MTREELKDKRKTKKREKGKMSRKGQKLNLQKFRRNQVILRKIAMILTF